MLSDKNLRTTTISYENRILRKRILIYITPSNTQSKKFSLVNRPLPIYRSNSVKIIAKRKANQSSISRRIVRAKITTTASVATGSSTEVDCGGNRLPAQTRRNFPIRRTSIAKVTLFSLEEVVKDNCCFDNAFGQVRSTLQHSIKHLPSNG